MHRIFRPNQSYNENPCVIHEINSILFGYFQFMIIVHQEVQMLQKIWQRKLKI